MNFAGEIVNDLLPRKDDAEAVEKILSLRRSFLDEALERSFDRLEFSVVHLEIGMQADEV